MSVAAPEKKSIFRSMMRVVCSFACAVMLLATCRHLAKRLKVMEREERSQAVHSRWKDIPVEMKEYETNELVRKAWEKVIHAIYTDDSTVLGPSGAEMLMRTLQLAKEQYNVELFEKSKKSEIDGLLRGALGMNFDQLLQAFKDNKVSDQQWTVLRANKSDSMSKLIDLLVQSAFPQNSTSRPYLMIRQASMYDNHSIYESGYLRALRLLTNEELKVIEKSLTLKGPIQGEQFPGKKE